MSIVPRFDDPGLPRAGLGASVPSAPIHLADPVAAGVPGVAGAAPTLLQAAPSSPSPAASIPSAPVFAFEPLTYAASPNTGYAVQPSGIPAPNAGESYYFLDEGLGASSRANPLPYGWNGQSLNLGELPSEHTPGIALPSISGPRQFDANVFRRDFPILQEYVNGRPLIWLDNAAADYKLTVNAGDNMLIDVPASSDTSEAMQKISQSLPQQVRLPDLKPWGLSFRGARLVVVNGRPAAQLVYVTDNKAIGPLTLVIGASKQPDIQRTFERRQDVNMLYWRHQGRAYALVGQTDIGWLWGIANDVAWQLDAI
jgi:hypothetical protein